uniref:Uncharacterized protein n=1 Tax=uncultured marine crenarchaeote HF4000_APKG10I20 TaxID=455612 RepID=B3TCA6_9ARCH|nr:hypothetical protein ALOHA_HF4000APKG10I20ctg7g2 [uncultured marine crenarchaeote HF4000_APKG10I20]
MGLFCSHFPSHPSLPTLSTGVKLKPLLYAFKFNLIFSSRLRGFCHGNQNL